MTSFEPYPDPEDPDFYQKIYHKQEFYSNRIEEKHLQQNIASACNPDSFVLQPYQRFVRNFLSPETPYRSLLLFHGTGTGKTCSAIQIAEGYKEEIARLGKKIYVIAKPQLQRNFQKELYNFEREKFEEIPGSLQCTGKEYYISPKKEPDESKRRKLVKQKIKQYYAFYGVRLFANYVDTVIKRQGSIADTFDNAMIIIDEAHSITGETKFKEHRKKKASLIRPTHQISDRGILDVLHDVITNSNNLKLVLMTATPMRDQATQIVDLLNLLRLNDRRPLIDVKHLFNDPTGRQLNKDYLKYIARGYVSYVRGENPLTFPQILEPPESQTYLPHPLYNERGALIDPDDWIQTIRLYKCPMSLYQYANLRKIIKDLLINKNARNIDQVTREAVNIIFPISADPYQGATGKQGFNRAFIDVSGRKYRYQSFNQNFLQIQHLPKWSMKFAKYLHNLLESPGITYTYTEWITMGVKPIAMMLEANGILRYRLPTAREDLSLMVIPEKDRVYRCAVCGKLKRDPIHQSNHQFIQAYYMVFTGEKQLTIDKYIDAELAVLNSYKNKDGYIIKHVIGNQVSAEGIDYKRIRQVHIIEGWHNNTRLQQVVGRASRHCSHVDLPVEERNVTVFRYSSALPAGVADLGIKVTEVEEDPDHLLSNNQLKLLVIPEEQQTYPSLEDLDKHYQLTYREIFMETPDEKIYRRVESKNLIVNQVIDILKVVAVDCGLNKLLNHRPGEPDYTCEGGLPPPNPIIPNRDTYNLYFIKPQIEQAVRIIYELFQVYPAFTLDYLVEAIREKHTDLEPEHIYQGLEQVLGQPPYIEPMTLVNRFGQRGYLIYRYPYYIFQPNDIDTQAPMWYRMHPLMIKRSYIPITTLSNRPSSKPKKVKINVSVRAAAGAAAPKAKRKKKCKGQIEYQYSVTVDQAIQLAQQPQGLYELGYYLDRTEPSQQAHIYESTKLPPTLRQFLNKFYWKRRLVWFSEFDYSNPPESVAPVHQINQQLRYFTGQQWITIDSNDPKIVDLLKTFPQGKPSQPSEDLKAPLIGFLDKIRTKLRFKILDLQKLEEIKQKGKVDRRYLPRGRVCETHEVPDINNFLVDMDYPGAPDSIKQLTNKESKCFQLELLFRRFDDLKYPLRYFFYRLPKDVLP